MAWRTFWYSRNKVKKYWKIQLSGTSYTVVSGRKGDDGKTTTKEFASPEEAERAYQMAISLTLSRSYREGDEQPRNIWAAVWEGNVPVVRELLHNPELCNERAPEGETPLHVAVSDRRTDIAKLLLEAGADINALGGEYKDTPFGLAIEEFGAWNKRDVEMVELLLQYRPDLSVVSEWGDPLSVRVMRDKELVKLVEKHGNALGSDPGLNLIAVFQEKGIAPVQKLLEANPKLCKSPHIAEILGSVVMGGNERAVKFVSFLFDNGVDPNLKCHDQPLIEWAVEQGGGPKVVRLLLERGADLKRLDQGGRALLLSAIYVRRPKEIIEDLIRFGVKTDLIVRLQMEGAKKVLAEIKKNPGLVRELADPVAFMNEAIGSKELVEHLLDLGVDPNAHGLTQPAPLRLAVQRLSFPVVKLLLERGADPNPKDSGTDRSVIEAPIPHDKAALVKKIVDYLMANGCKGYADPQEQEKYMKLLDRLARGAKRR